MRDPPRFLRSISSKRACLSLTFPFRLSTIHSSAQQAAALILSSKHFPHYSDPAESPIFITSPCLDGPSYSPLERLTQLISPFYSWKLVALK
jgi:hypothetical protein